MSGSLARRVAANATAAFASQATILLLGLATTAVLVRTMGAARFGAWSLVMALTAYLGLLDLGLGVALVRRVATAAGDDSGSQIARASAAALGALTILAVAAGFGLVLAAAPLSQWLGIAEADRHEFVAAVRIGAVGAALALPGVALGAIPTAFQRLDSIVRLEAVVSGCVMVAQVALVLAGGGIAVLAAAFSAGRAASLIARVLLARSLLGELGWRLDPTYPFWKELGRFGALKVVHQLSSHVVLYLDRVLVGVLVSVEAVAYYTVAVDLAQRLLMIPGNVGAAYYPAACAAVNDRGAAGSLYVGSSRAVALLTLPPAFGLALLAGPVLRTWVGAEFVGPVAGLLQVTALAYGAMALTAVPAAAADAHGHPEISARYGVAGVALNLGLALVLIPKFGTLGACWALAGNVVLQSPWFVRRVTDLVGVPLAQYARSVLIGPLVPAAAAAAAIAVTSFALGPAGGAASLFAGTAAGAAAFVAAGRLLGTLGPHERGFMAAVPGGKLLRWVVRGA